MGRHAIRMLKFAIKYRGWNGYGTDATTVRALRTLLKHGFVEINDYRQFRLHVN